MKLIFFCFLCLNFALANEYYAKLEPIETYKIKSSVSGKIIYSNEEIEGKTSNKTLIIKIDSKLDEIDLTQSKRKLDYINQMIEIEQNNYDRLNKVSSKSAFEKDTQKLKVVNLKSSKADLVSKIENLKDNILNKNLIENKNYITNIFVKKGDYVNPGTLLYESADLTKGKLEFFVPITKIEEIKNKTIFLDDVKTDLKINKIYMIADSSHISSYKVKLEVENINVFSRLVKIEFR